MSAQQCTRDDCTEISYGRGLCSRHYKDARRRLIAYGRWDPWQTDTVALLEHLNQLTRVGLSAGKIALLAGVSAPTVAIILATRPSRVRRSTADRLMTVEPVLEALPATSLIPSVGAQRRLQALVTLGWSQASLDQLLSFSHGRVSHILRNNRVLVGHHLAVAELYDRLWNITAPETTRYERISATRAHRQAARNGWLPPLAWDDPDTDTQPPTPQIDLDDVDEYAVELACAGEPVKLNYTERRLAVSQLARLQLSDPQIADRLGLSSRTALRIRHEPTLAAALDLEELVVA